MRLLLEIFSFGCLIAGIGLVASIIIWNLSVVWFLGVLILFIVCGLVMTLVTIMGFGTHPTGGSGE